MANRSQWCGLWPTAQAPTSWRTTEAKWWWRRRSRRSLTGFWCPSTSRWGYSCILRHPATCFLQVDNPIAVLNQDTAKTFLFKCDPDKLYTFFMRATQVQYLEFFVRPQSATKKSLAVRVVQSRLQRRPRWKEHSREPSGGEEAIFTRAEKGTHQVRIS